jgi:glycosyltransferase involved in cell wall biosynthesis
VHILYVIDSLVPAGAESSLAALAPHLRDRGVRLDVAYLHERPGLHDALRQAGASLFPVAGPGGKRGATRRVHALIRDRRPDLVHTTLFEADISGRLAAWWTRTPVVSTLASDKYGVDHLTSPALQPWRVRVAQGADAATARLTTRLHAVSAYVADVMATRLLYPRSRIDVVPRGRDADALGRRSHPRRQAARAALGVSGTTSVLLAVARQDRQKGLDVLLDAVSRLAGRAEFRVLVAGREGNHTKELEEYVRRHGLGEMVRFLGLRRDVPELLCAADVFVLPSRREGLPGSVLEAMALEVPIVVSDLPQTREVVDERSAVLVPPDSREGLAAAIRSVLSATGTAKRRTEHARARFLRHFTMDLVTDEMLGFYERCTRGGAPLAAPRAGRVA